MIIKRIFDFVISLIGLIILFPILFIIAIIIKLDSHGPILFRQIRVGQYERKFFIHKFRTMVNNAETVGPKITIGEDSRVTSCGKILRKTKLDELPQLWDVLIGHMSLVGPRPEVPEYVKLYPLDTKKQILSVRPGITDPASIIMVNESEILARHSNPSEAYIEEIMPKKIAISLRYVANRSFFGDLKIILATVGKLFHINIIKSSL